MFGGNKFEILGVDQQLAEKCNNIGWNEPTEIQRKVIPLMLKGNDVVALAETGSGKTGSFAIPIIQKLFSKPKNNFALILTPTHELALQIQNEFMKLGEDDGLKVGTIVGGDFVEDQVKLLKSNKFHIIVGTPGRIVLHINKNTLNFKGLSFFILDEADRMLSDDFVSDLQTITNALPKNRQSCLFSATMTNKLEKLETVCVKNPLRVEVSRKHQTVSTLTQEMVFLRDDDERVLFLIWKLMNISSNSDNENQLSSAIVFTETKKESKILSRLLDHFAISVVMLQSDLTRIERQQALHKFSTGKVSVLVATDVASRGLDIPNVGLVINFNVPESCKDYLHRVGRTARAGRSGLAISLVTVYTAVNLLMIEKEIGIQMSKISLPREEITDLKETVQTVLVKIKKEIKEEQEIEAIQKNKKQLKKENNLKKAQQKHKLK